MPRPWRDDRRASVTVLFGVLAAVLFGFAALALDLVTIWIARRNLQGAADLAAVLAAAGPGAPRDIATRTLTDNGFASDLGRSEVVVGAYTADARTPVDRRFVAAASPANAVKVSAATTVQTTFSRILGLPSTFDVRATATARSADFAAFSLGSGGVSLNEGVANALLGALLGASVSLRAADYNALATARVNAFDFLDALATRADLTVGDYDRILSANVTLAEALSALSASLPGGTAATAIGSLVRALGGPGGNLNAGSVVPLGDVPAGRRGTALDPSMDVLEMLTNAISIANGVSQVDVDLGPSIPGLLGTRIKVAIGQRKVSSGFVQPESSGSTLRAGQVRALIEARLTIPLLGNLSLPIYLQAATATARLVSVSCPWRDPTRKQVAIDARPGVADLAIANVQTSSIDLARPPPSLTERAPLLTLPLLTVSGLARATWDAPYAQRLTFDDGDIRSHRIRSVASSQAVSSIATSLVSGLSLDINGLDLVAVLGLQRTLRPALELVAPALDGVIDTTLRTLGIRLGYADVAIDGIRCGRAVLVQ